MKSKANSHTNNTSSLSPELRNLFQAAVHLYNKGHYEQAGAAFSKIIKEAPSHENSYDFRGWSYSRQKDYKKAISDFTIAIRLNPLNAKMYRNRAYNYNNMGLTSQALKDYTNAIQLNPKFAEAYYRRGYLHSDNKKGLRGTE